MIKLAQKNSPNTTKCFVNKFIRNNHDETRHLLPWKRKPVPLPDKMCLLIKSYHFIFVKFLKMKVLIRFLTAMPWKNYFPQIFSHWFFKEPSVSYLFTIWRTLFTAKNLM